MAGAASSANKTPFSAHAIAARFAVLCDSHIESRGDVRLRYVEQAVHALKALRPPPEFVVFLGDMASAKGNEQQSSHASAMQVIECERWPTYVLRGNTDLDLPPARFAFEMGGCAFVGFDTAGGTYGSDEDQVLASQVERWSGLPVVLFTHFYPEALDDQSRRRLVARLEGIDNGTLICGHGHRAQQYRLGKTIVHLVAPTDPFKPGGAPPGAEIFSISPSQCRRTRRNVSLLDDDMANAFSQSIGVAIEANLIDEAFLAWAGEHSIVRWQIKQYAKADAAQRAMLLQLVGQITLHASTPKLSAGGVVGNQPQLDDEIQFAKERHLTAITTHLPPVDARTLFDASGEPKARSTACLADALASAWAGYWLAGIRIDIENTHWYDPDEQPELFGEHQLGIRPRHLLAFRERVEAELRKRHGPVEGASVGLCLDVGHVLTNGPLASEFGWTEWLDSLRPHVRSIHFHDVIAGHRGGRQGHQPVGIEGGLINVEAIAHLAQRDCPSAPIYLEVGGRHAIGVSLENLNRWRNVRRSETSWVAE